jgi:hypothetical protein
MTAHKLKFWGRKYHWQREVRLRCIDSSLKLRSGFFDKLAVSAVIVYLLQMLRDTTYIARGHNASLCDVYLFPLSKPDRRVIKKKGKTILVTGRGGP